MLSAAINERAARQRRPRTTLSHVTATGSAALAFLLPALLSSYYPDVFALHWQKCRVASFFCRVAIFNALGIIEGSCLELQAA